MVIIVFLFKNCEYNENYVTEVNNVIIILKTNDLSFQDNTFDTIISSKYYKHCP